MKKQMSESIRLGVVLAIAGGFMDAYSYMCRGKVFANAQTGNILLLGIHLSEKNCCGDSPFGYNSAQVKRKKSSALETDFYLNRGVCAGGGMFYPAGI